MDILVNTEITLPRSNLDVSPIPQAPPQWITFLPFISQNILLNIKDVEFDFSMGCILVLFPFLWIINVLCTNFLDFWNFDLIFSKMIDIGLLWSKIMIFTIEITLKQLLITKYGWNNPNWGRLGLTNPKLHFYDISGSSKFIANINTQINVARSIFIINSYFLF